MQPRLCIMTLGVADLTAAKRFYLEGLGWPEVAHEASDSICFIQMPGMLLSLYPIEGLADDIGIPAEPLPRFRGSSCAYNTVSKEETDEVLATAVAAGATLLKPAQEVFWGGYSGYFTDPDGHTWEVAYNPFSLPDAQGAFRMESSSD